MTVGTSALNLDAYRDQFKILADWHIYGLAIRAADMSPVVRRLTFDRRMASLMEWRAALEKPAERRA